MMSDWPLCKAPPRQDAAALAAPCRTETERVSPGGTDRQPRPKRSSRRERAFAPPIRRISAARLSVLVEDQLLVAVLVEEAVERGGLVGGEV